MNRKDLRKLIIVVSLVAVMAIAVPLGGGCFPRAAAPPPEPAEEELETIKLGLNTPLTGGMASLGQNVLKGAILAVEDINAAGGILGHPVELVTADNEFIVDIEIANTKRLVTSDKVRVVFGSFAEPGLLEGYEFSSQYNVPNIGSGCTGDIAGPIVTEDPDKYWGMYLPTPPSASQAEAMIDYLEYLVNEGLYIPQSKNIVITGDDSAWGLSNMQLQRNYLSEGRSPLSDQGWKVTFFDHHAYGEADFLAVMSNIKAQNPAAVFNSDASVPGGVAYLKQFRDAGIQSLLFNTYMPASSEFSDIAGDAVNGLIYGTNIIMIPNDRGWAFVQRVEDKFGVNLGLECNVGLGYDVPMQIKAAYEKVGNLDDMRAWGEAFKTSRYDGLVGTFLYDDETHVAKTGSDFIPTMVWQFQDGERVVMTPADFAQGEYQTPDWIK